MSRSPEMPSLPYLKAKKVIDRGKIEDKMELQNQVIIIDFSETSSFTDPNPAIMCIEVLTSDGRLGTLTHVTTEADPESLAKALLKVHGQPVPVCLVGGDDFNSTSLLTALTKTLTQHGFTVSESPEHSNLRGKNVMRRSTLFPDKVVVKHEPYSGPAREVVLTFPKEE